MTLTVRVLQPSDLDAIYAIDQLCFPPSIAYSRDIFEICLRDRDCVCLGLDREDRLAAFAALYFPAPASAHLITIDVHPDFRRQGLGRRLMEEVEARARQRQVRRTHLQVAVDNRAAQSLYESLGFTVRARLDDYYGPGLAALLMDKHHPAAEVRPWRR